MIYPVLYFILGVIHCIKGSNSNPFRFNSQNKTFLNTSEFGLDFHINSLHFILNLLFAVPASTGGGRARKSHVLDIATRQVSYYLIDVLLF